eukprot:14433-Heterococcus_DN1.PRE.1
MVHTACQGIIMLYSQNTVARQSCSYKSHLDAGLMHCKQAIGSSLGAMTQESVRLKDPLNLKKLVHRGEVYVKARN